MHRVVFMGTPAFAVPALQTLIETQTVVGVVTQPDKPAGRGKKMRPSPVKVAAEAANIPVFQPKSLRKPERAEQIREWRPDVIIVAAFGQILRPHLLDFPEHGCINIHASLLPRWRGASPIQHAILSGDAESGVCLMKMDVGLDTGGVFACEGVGLAADETAQTLHDKLAQLGSLLIKRDLPNVLNGELIPLPQDDELATYAPMISKSDGEIEWARSAVEIGRLVRAMTPWPGAFTYWQDKLLKVKQGTPCELSGFDVGEVVAIERESENEIAVQTGDGGFILQTIQLQGKRAMPITDFVNGHGDFMGTTLGGVE